MFGVSLKFPSLATSSPTAAAGGGGGGFGLVEVSHLVNTKFGDLLLYISGAYPLKLNGLWWPHFLIESWDQVELYTSLLDDITFMRHPLIYLAGHYY